MTEGGNTSKVTMRSKKHTYLPSRPSDEGCERTKQSVLEKAWGWGGSRALREEPGVSLRERRGYSENKLRITEILVIMSSEL